MYNILIAAFFIALIAAPRTEGTLTIQLSEKDYSVDSDQAILAGEVVTSGLSQDPVQIQLLPLTFEEYAQLYPNSDGPCTIPTGVNAAESTDFDQTVILIEKAADPTGNNEALPFQVSLPVSSTVEAEETFLLLLNTTSENVIIGQRDCSTVKIGSALPPTRNFIELDRQGDVEISESSNFNVLFSIIKTVETELPIRIMLSADRSSATKGVDFIIPNEDFTIAPEQSGAQVNLTILDDGIAEDNESFYLRVRASIEGIAFPFLTLESQITILDDEVVVLGFADEMISVFEGEEAEFCARFLNDSAIEYTRFSLLSFPLSTADGSAKVGTDYIAISPRYTYRPVFNLDPVRRACFNVQTIDNSDTQPSRSFTVNFDSSQGTALTIIRQSSVQINILDDDGPPSAPEIQEAVPEVDSKTLLISWTVESSRQNPINSFTGTIRVVGSDEGEAIQFTVSNGSARAHTLQDYQGEKKYEIVICALNSNSMACSIPFSVPVTIFKTDKPPPIIGEDPDLSPGLIAVIVVIVVAAVLLCCLFLVVLLLCLLCRTGREKSYYPEKAKSRELSGHSRSDSNSYSFSETDTFHSPHPETIPL